MKVYMAWLFDWWWEQSIPIGVYTTESLAAKACEIVIKQKRKEEPENVPDDRYDVNIEETYIDGYSANCIRAVHSA